MLEAHKLFYGFAGQAARCEREIHNKYDVGAHGARCIDYGRFEIDLFLGCVSGMCLLRQIEMIVYWRLGIETYLLTRAEGTCKFACLLFHYMR